MRRISYVLRSFLFALALGCLWAGSVAAAAAEPLAWVEQVQVLRTDATTQIVVKGVMPSDMTSVVKVRSGEPNILVEGWSVSPRSGKISDFEFTVISPKFQNGGYFPLAIGVEYENKYHPLIFQSGNELAVHVPVIYGRHWVMLIVILITVGLGFSRRFQTWCGRLGRWVECHQRKLAWGIGCLALLLVAVGWTGSSWRRMADSYAGQSFLEWKGSQWHSRSFKLDRWDEWGVITPAVFAQLNHEPKFPIVNTNIGLEGQNMGVVGMFGVPIAQVAALARPATWGYFVLPLRQAMSWQWQIQFWGCLLAIWWFLNTLRTGQAGRNLALSTSFCMVPYAAGWSNWPLYASLFPVLGVCLLAKLFRAKTMASAALLGVALGWVLASWVLVLYPPWLVIVGSLCALLMLGWIVDHRKELVWRGPQWLALICVVTVASVLLGSWWLDTRDAVAQIQATVYPGGRQTELGGNASIIWLLRGYLGLEAFANDMGPASNKPEVSSYFFVPLAMTAVLLWGAVKSPRPKGVWLGLVAFVVIYALYCFVGFPLWLAQTSKWGVLTINRMDLGLGLAAVVLACMLRSPSSAGVQTRHDLPARRVACFVHAGTGIVLAGVSAALAWWVLAHISPNLMPHNPWPYRTAVALMCAAMAWWIWREQAIGLTLAMLVMGFGAAFTYTPISRAPEALWLSDATKPFVIEEGQPHLAKTLVVDSDSLPAMTLAALGVPVIDGPLYYPHRSLWQSMQLPEDQWPMVNRYQHLTFIPEKGVENPLHYRVTSPGMDAVRVFFDPIAFDFTLTRAERVVSHETLAPMLDENPKLERIGHHRQYVWFRVK